jgi:hypothetical protein
MTDVTEDFHLNAESGEGLRVGPRRFVENLDCAAMSARFFSRLPLEGLLR